MNYFKKEIPKTPIDLPNGTRIKFPTHDGLVGYLETEDEDTIKWLRELQKKHIGGVFEIEKAEYEADFKKKAHSTASNHPWREEVGGGIMPDTTQPRIIPPLATSAEVAGANPTLLVAPPAPAETEKPTPKPPTVGRRPK